MSGFSPSELPRVTELLLERSDTTAANIEDLCKKAGEQKVYGVCVSSSRVERAVSLLEDTEIKVTALIASPFGTADADVKRYETEVAVDYGAQEIEVIMNVGRLKENDRNYVLRELRDVAEAADERLVKVDIQPHLLVREEILLACELVLDSGAHFICSSPGQPANFDHIKLLREAVGEKFGVKAGGGITGAGVAMALIEAGATRLGI